MNDYLYNSSKKQVVKNALGAAALGLLSYGLSILSISMPISVVNSLSENGHELNELVSSMEAATEEGVTIDELKGLETQLEAFYKDFNDIDSFDTMIKDFGAVQLMYDETNPAEKEAMVTYLENAVDRIKSVNQGWREDTGVSLVMLTFFGGLFFLISSAYTVSQIGTTALSAIRLRRLNLLSKQARKQLYSKK